MGFQDFLDKQIISDIKSQYDKIQSLKKMGLKVVKTSELVKGNKYRPVLSEKGYNEFIVDEIKLDEDMKSIPKNEVTNIAGKLYIIKARNWYFQFNLFENEWFVLVEDNSKSKEKTVLKPKTPSKKSGGIKRKTKRNHRKNNINI